MYRVFLVMTLISLVMLCNAQKSDYTWLSGYQSNYHSLQDSITTGFTVGNMILSFRDDSLKISYDSLSMNFDKTNVTYSDSNGNVLFYSNGIYVANSLNEPIENSDSLNAGYIDLVWDPNIFSGGYRNSQGILCLQSIVNRNQYYLISSFLDTLPNSNESNLYCSKILVALADMSLNNGLGKVVYKNQIIIEDSIAEEIQCVRHGNGRDWWILVQKQNSNCFYRVLVDTGGFKVMSDLACLGSSMPMSQIGAACFSPDGTKYVYLGAWSGLNIYDFDRCTGLLNNPRNFPLPSIVDSGWSGIGVCISPNSRYLYVSVTHQLYQFDLWANNIFTSIDTVGIYNGGHLPNTPQVETIFYTQQLAPDGKIYMSCGNSVPYYHVINNPDEKGTLCNFVQDGVVLPTLTIGIPNYPNYRLGSLTQSQCDSLTTFTQDMRDAKEKILKVFPNPAMDIVTVDYGFTDWNKGAVSLELTNDLGQVVYTQPVPIYSGFQKLDVRQFAPGMYDVSVKRDGAVVAVAKMIKE